MFRTNTLHCCRNCAPGRPENALQLVHILLFQSWIQDEEHENNILRTREGLPYHITRTGCIVLKTTLTNKQVLKSTAAISYSRRIRTCQRYTLEPGFVIGQWRAALHHFEPRLGCPGCWGRKNSRVIDFDCRHPQSRPMTSRGTMCPAKVSPQHESLHDPMLGISCKNACSICHFWKACHLFELHTTCKP